MIDQLRAKLESPWRKLRREECSLQSESDPVFLFHSNKKRP